MRAYTLTHLSDAALLRDLASLVARDRSITAALLAHIAEVDARRLYLPAGYTSMHAYCVGELHLSEDAAFKRIRAARAARDFPVLFPAVAEGRIHLAGVCLLAPHLTRLNADELLAAASFRSRDAIEQLLARRFPPPEVLALSTPIPSQLAPGRVEREFPAHAELAPGRVAAPAPPAHAAAVAAGELAPGRVDPPARDGGRFLVQLTIGQATRDKLEYAQALLSHAHPTADAGLVLDRALDLLIGHLEKRKFAATDRPRPRAQAAQPRASAARRHVPSAVKRAVWERDRGRCTFVGGNGHRCGARRFLEFDHVEPVARGGKATVEGMRLRCRKHNQYEAERAFGTEFMNGKRGKAREAAEAAEAARQAAEASGQRAAEQTEQTRDVIAALRGLGARADEARRAAESAESLAGATLEERLRAALRMLGPRPKPAPVASARPIALPPSPVAAGTAEGAVAAGVSPA